MKVVTLQRDTLYRLLDTKHNPPNVQDQKDENQFQAEIRALYDQLIDCLAPFGEEGDYGDYSVGPDLKIRPTVMGFAPHRREFVINVLTQDFFYSDYVGAIHTFLSEGAAAYRIVLYQHADSEWMQVLILTSELAQVYSSNTEELDRLLRALVEL